MASLTQTVSQSGVVTVICKPMDGLSVFVTKSGVYSGLRFILEGSSDGHTYFGLAAVNAGSGELVVGEISPADNSTNGWFIPCEGVRFVRSRVTALFSGTANIRMETLENRLLESEEQWLLEKRPRSLFEYLTVKNLLSSRKARMMAVACCQEVGRDLFTLEVYEARGIYGDDGKVLADIAWAGGWCSIHGHNKPPLPVRADIIRDIAGNPFRKVDLDGSKCCYHWMQSLTVKNIAEKIYAERKFSDMPILADALEDAGCTDALILDHCRLQQKHWRGCWLLDLILGK